jgi:cation:H+ antiporter
LDFNLIWIFAGFIIGIIIIMKGGDYFVTAATWMAEVLRIPKFIIGATIVSIATTLPEILVSAFASASGKTDMAVGNAIGSITANTGLALAIGIIAMPVIVQRKTIMAKTIILLVAMSTLWVISLSGEITIWKSLILMAIFAVFIFENLIAAKRGDIDVADLADSSKKAIAINLMKFAAGAAGIIIGSRLLVDNGSGIARLFGVPENVIGLTAIAVGTSLPELVTAITAISRKQFSLSFGNVIGANIIDTAVTLPLCALISGGVIPVLKHTIWIDIPVCFIIICITLVPTLIRKKFSRWQGVTALILYASYIAYIFVAGNYLIFPWL